MRSLVLFSIILIAGCAVDEQKNNYSTSSDIQLTTTNHPLGWSQKQCFACHIPSKLHLVNRRNHTSFDLAKGLVEQYGIQICSTCHGNNGVSP